MDRHTWIVGLTLWLSAAFVAQSREPLPGVVFVSDEIFGPKFEWPGLTIAGTLHSRDGYIYHRATSSHPLERTTTPTRPGQNLYTLAPAAPHGKLTRITHLAEGAVFDPEPSYDGRKILFSMRRDGEDWYNLYEIGADGQGLVQLTDGPFNDVSGVYLPDGRIVFVSDRGGYLEEYHEERTETLWIMNGDGSGIRQLTFNPGTVFDPTVLADGRILFSLWDTFMLNIPPADKHETYLMTIRPDGTEEGHFFGAGEHRFFDRERHSGVAYTQAGQMPDGAILVQTEMGPSILDPRRGLAPLQALWPVFPGTTSVQLGGATHRVHLSPTGSRSTPYPLPDGRFLFSGTLPGARDIGVYLADPKTRRVELVFNDPATSEFDPRPIYLERPRPAELPAKSAFGSPRGVRSIRERPGGLRIASGEPRERSAASDRESPPLVAVTGRARFAVLDVRRSDNPQHAKVLHRARYLRVVEALHTAVTTFQPHQPGDAHPGRRAGLARRVGLLRGPGGHAAVSGAPGRSRPPSGVRVGPLRDVRPDWFAADPDGDVVHHGEPRRSEIVQRLPCNSARGAPSLGPWGRHGLVARTSPDRTRLDRSALPKKRT